MLKSRVTMRKEVQNKLGLRKQTLDISDPSNVTSNTKKRAIKSTRKTNIAIVSTGSIFTITGLIVMIVTVVHMSVSNELCSNPNTNTLESHPELKLWDQCTFQTLPFGSNSDELNCNCRQTDIDLSTLTINNDNERRNVSIMVESIFLNWDMLGMYV